MQRLLQAFTLGAILFAGAQAAQAEPCYDSRSCGGSYSGCDRGGYGCGHGCNLFQRRIGPNTGGGKYSYSSPCTSYGMAGPSEAQWPTVAYPYYTTRGPRDFFVNNPPSIGR